MKANRENVTRSKALFDQFGAASGLHCDWSKTKAVHLAPGPIPQNFFDFNWTWESQENASKYLGIFKGNQISRLLANKHLIDKLQLRLDGLGKDRPTSLVVRVVTKNHLILAMLWCMLSLWVGSDVDINHIQSIITRFIWT